MFFATIQMNLKFSANTVPLSLKPEHRRQGRYLRSGTFFE